VGALLKKHGVKVVKGWAAPSWTARPWTCSQPEAKPVRIQGEHLLLATGSVELALPGMPFGGRVISVHPGPVARPAFPPPGGGGRRLHRAGTGLVYRKLGADVTVVEAQNRILPLYDEELTKPVAASLRKLGVQVHLGSRVQGLNAAATRCACRTAPGA
jgi:dihydrolipoamide dehydrogenase